jgi:hypothetical protein
MSKFVGTGPSYKKKNLPGRGLTKVENDSSIQWIPVSFPGIKAVGA